MQIQILFMVIKQLIVTMVIGLVGATCAQTQPGDECKRSAVWGKCNK